MKNLIGFSTLLKILAFLLLFSFLNTSVTFSQDKISQEAEIYYTIDDENKTSFKYIIKLSTEPDYTTAISNYTLSFPFEELKFDTIRVEDEDLQAHKEVGSGVTQLTINLQNRILNHRNSIYIEIDGKIENTLIRETEDTRILILPGSMSNVEVKKVEIKHPRSFGEISNFNNEWVLQYDKEEITLKTFEAGKVINLVWGEKIAYDFKIKKNLSNSLNEPTKTFDINIPKSYGNQKVYFLRISPQPNFAYQDAEKNLFFSYELPPGTELEINIVGQVVIDFFEQSNKNINTFEKPILTETSGYWLLDNEYELNRLKLSLAKRGVKHQHIDEMEPEERQKFYKAAYTYVVERLELANVRSSSMESNLRQGANNAVTNRSTATPEDYVDLLSSIYRLYGVPTKMIEGYVIMLNQGFYHSWLEFWCKENGWEAIDPALESFSNGNYFNNELYNHIIILSRGYNYIRPRMTFFDNDEMVIDFAESITDENLSVVNSARLNPLRETQSDVMGILEVKNTGNAIISIDNLMEQKQFSFTNHNALQIIVPNQTMHLPFLYRPNVLTKGKDEVLLKYTSINGDELLNPLHLDVQQEQYWWWTPLITTLKFTAISIIVYILYIIWSKTFRWIKKYYQ